MGWVIIGGISLLLVASGAVSSLAFLKGLGIAALVVIIGYCRWYLNQGDKK